MCVICSSKVIVLSHTYPKWNKQEKEMTIDNSSSMDISMASSSSGISEQMADIEHPNQINNMNPLIMFDTLIRTCQNNSDYFKFDNTDEGQRLLDSFQNISERTAIARSYVDKTISFMHEYDFDGNTPANGYRCFVIAMQACIARCVKVCQHVSRHRDDLLFRKSVYIK